MRNVASLQTYIYSTLCVARFRSDYIVSTGMDFREVPSTAHFVAVFFSLLFFTAGLRTSTAITVFQVARQYMIKPFPLPNKEK